MKILATLTMLALSLGPAEVASAAEISCQSTGPSVTTCERQSKLTSSAPRFSVTWGGLFGIAAGGFSGSLSSDTGQKDISCVFSPSAQCFTKTEGFFMAEQEADFTVVGSALVGHWKVAVVG